MADDVLEEVRAIFKKNKALMEEEKKRIWDETDYDIKLAITGYVMDRIYEHAKEGGTIGI